MESVYSLSALEKHSSAYFCNMHWITINLNLKFAELTSVCTIYLMSAKNLLEMHLKQYSSLYGEHSKWTQAEKCTKENMFLSNN